MAAWASAPRRKRRGELTQRGRTRRCAGAGGGLRGGCGGDAAGLGGGEAVALPDPQAGSGGVRNRHLVSLQGRGMAGRGRGGFGGRGRGRGRGRGSARPALTKEQLDNQLDAYMSKTKGHLDAELDAYMAQTDPETND